MPAPDDALRIAFLIYRGNRHCGGQGIYTRHLTRELANLGHHVEVLSGPPYPEIDDPVVLHELGGIDFYGGRKPMRKTAFLDIRSDIDLLEYLMVCTAAFPEPFTFSLRAWRHRLHLGQTTMAALCESFDWRLDLRQMAYFSHWLTPVPEGA